MKSLTRFFTLFLAAILCGTFLSACANSPEPPVADTTDSASVASSTANGAAENATSAGSSSVTEPAEDTSVSADTDSAQDTSVPADTDPSEDNGNADSQNPLNDLLYYTDDGYVKIKGADTIKLPSEGSYYKFSGNDDLYVFACDVLNTTESVENVPATEGTNSPHSIYIKDGAFVISYMNNSQKTEVEILPENFKTFCGDEKILANASKYQIDTYNISNELAVFSFSDGISEAYIVTIHDQTALCNVTKVDFIISSVAYNDNVNGVAITYGSPAASSCTTGIYVTSNGGQSFKYYANSPYPFAWNSKLYFINETSVYYSGTERIFDTPYATESHPLEKYECRSFFDDNVFHYIYVGLTGYDRSLDRNLEILSPYFEGDIGVCAVKNLFGDTYQYMYFITIDGGASWSLYSPLDILNNNIPSNVIELKYKTPMA